MFDTLLYSPGPLISSSSLDKNMHNLSFGYKGKKSYNFIKATLFISFFIFFFLSLKRVKPEQSKHVVSSSSSENLCPCLSRDDCCLIISDRLLIPDFLSAAFKFACIKGEKHISHPDIKALINLSFSSKVLQSPVFT